MHNCPVCGNECDCDAAEPTDEEVEETLPRPEGFASCRRCRLERSVGGD